MSARLTQSRIGVLGTGEVGRRLASGFASRGHRVMIGTRDPDKPDLREWLSGEGAGIPRVFGNKIGLSDAGNRSRASSAFACSATDVLSRVFVCMRRPLAEARRT